jgi:CIC family chloride channel protein
VLIVPVVGGLIYGPLVSRFAPEARGHGVPEVMLAVNKLGVQAQSARCASSGASGRRDGLTGLPRRGKPAAVGWLRGEVVDYLRGWADVGYSGHVRARVERPGVQKAGRSIVQSHWRGEEGL